MSIGTHASNKKIRLSILTGLAVLAGMAAILAWQQPVSVPVDAPLNPELAALLALLERGDPAWAESAGEFYGYIPPSIDFTARNELCRDWLETANWPLAALPAKFDLRSAGRITPVRNQEQCGSCWAFGTLASLESCQLPGFNTDFSENHLKNTHGFSWGPCSGGNTILATAYLARWSGPVWETDDPYQPNSNPSPLNLPTRAHAREIIFLPDRSGALDNDLIKQAVMSEGAVSAGMNMNAKLNTAWNSYYYKGGKSSNHIVAIAGWDDDFDKTRFSPVPAGNGAFIVKNSWGESWGENGYMYVSYYDTAFAYSDVVQFRKLDPVNNFRRLYQYDWLGWTGSYGFSGKTAGWGANIFTSMGNEKVAAVSFYTYAPNTSYQISFRRNVTTSPRTGEIIAGSSGTVELPGYHTVAMAQPMAVSAGQRFAVIVKLDTPGYQFPIPLETRIQGYSASSEANAGEGFVSPDGSNWTDLITIGGHSNSSVCIKAFTTALDDCDLIITRQPRSQKIDQDEKVSLAVTVAGTGPLTYQWYEGESPDTAHPVSGATASTFTSPALKSDTNYWVKVSNTKGSVVSATAFILVDTEIPPTILTHPSNQTILSGLAAGLKVVVKGPEPRYYQWYEGMSGNTAIPVKGAKEPFFVSPPLKAPVSYWVRVSNEFGYTDSKAAAITITHCAAASIRNQPAGKVINPGQKASLSVTAAGTTPLKYQWYTGTAPDLKNPVSGATASSFTTPALTASAKYWVLVENACGTAASTTAAVTVVTGKPAGPDHLRAVRVAAGRVRLIWDDCSTDETAFIVERRQGKDGVWQEAGRTVTNCASYEDSGAAAGAVWYYRVCSQNSAGQSAYSNVASASDSDYDLIIPAAAHNSTWRTDLNLLNPGSVPADVQIALLLMGKSNLAPATVNVTIPPGQTVRLADILGSTFTASNAALGLRILTGTAKANARFYNIGTGKGTFGMGIEGLTGWQALPEDATRCGIFHHLINNLNYRTNLGFTNASAFPVTVRITLNGDSAGMLTSRTHSLQPYENFQFTKVFDAFGVTKPVNSGWISLEVLTEGGKIHAYTMVIDNLSADPVWWNVSEAGK